MAGRLVVCLSSLLLSSSTRRRFDPQRSSGQAVVTGVVPSPPRHTAVTLNPQSYERECRTLYESGKCVCRGDQVGARIVAILVCTIDKSEICMCINS